MIRGPLSALRAIDALGARTMPAPTPDSIASTSRREGRKLDVGSSENPAPSDDLRYFVRLISPVLRRSLRNDYIEHRTNAWIRWVSALLDYRVETSSSVAPSAVLPLVP